MRSPQVVERQLLHLVEHRLRQRRAGEPEHLEPAEESCCAAASSARKIGQQRLVALRHGEVPGRRDLAQVRSPWFRSAPAPACPRRCTWCRRCRARSPKSWLPPAVWCHGAQSTITGRLVLRRTPAREDHHLVRAPHALGVDHPFGMPVEPEVNRNLAIVSGPTAACAASTAGVGGGREQVTEQRARPARQSDCAPTTTSTSGGTTASIARANAARRRRRRQARREQGDDVPELAEVLRDQRIGAARSARRGCRHTWRRGPSAHARCRCRTGSTIGRSGERSRLQQRRADARARCRASARR